MGWPARICNLEGPYPFPSAVDVAAARAALLALPEGLPVVVDGLALGALPEAAAEVAARAPLVALVHHPLALETGLTAAQARALAASERAALRHARRVIVTSPATARGLAGEYGVPAERLVVALPGTDPAPLAAGSTPLQLLNVGAVVPRKDQVALVRALAPLRGLPWRLVIAGSLTRDPATAGQLRASIDEAGLGPRVDLLGEADDAMLARHIAASDLFVSTARFEGYGMAITEALAAGLPVVAVAGGAVAETLPREAGLLVPEDDPKALEEALRRVLTHEGLRGKLREGARAARANLPRWQDAAQRVADVLDHLG